MATLLNFKNADGSALVLPDGRSAASVNRFELAHALVNLGVDGVTPESGVQESLCRYAAHLRASRPFRPYSAQSAANDFVRETQEQAS